MAKSEEHAQLLLSTLLKPIIAERFAAHRPIFHEGLEPFVTFDPKWLGFGLLALWDDADEVTIYFGDFTHQHVGNFDDALNENEKSALIARDVVRILDDTFADRIEFFVHERGGGCGPVGTFGHDAFSNRPGTRRGVWSGAIPEAS